MKISAVVIWYNPNLNCINNIKTYSSYMERIYIVDNSSVNNEMLCKNITNAVYMPLLENMGIAKAQNVGCQRAFDDGFEWCMTMDQDSYWQEEALKSYIKNVHNYINKGSFFSFGPNVEGPEIITYYQEFKNIIKKMLHYKGKVYVASEKKDVENIDILIASGNIISLAKWKELDGFKEDLFIDEVDHDFCLRLNLKYPGSILKFNKIFMGHILGEPKKTLFKRHDFHRGVRLYYCVRNVLYMRDWYPEYDKRWVRVETYKQVFKENLRDFRIKDVYFMIKGYFAYKKHKTGKYTK